MTTPTIDVAATVTARDVEVTCCMDCCAKFSRTPKVGDLSPGIHPKIIKKRGSETVMVPGGTGVAKTDKVATPIIKDKETK